VHHKDAQVWRCPGLVWVRLLMLLLLKLNVLQQLCYCTGQRLAAVVNLQQISLQRSSGSSSSSRLC
jgi:hypothetical protein